MFSSVNIVNDYFMYHPERGIRHNKVLEEDKRLKIGAKLKPKMITNY